MKKKIKTIKTVVDDEYVKEVKKIAKALRKDLNGGGWSKFDQKTLRKLAKLIDAMKEDPKKGKEAYKFYKSMDTFVRGGVPRDVLSFLCTNRAGGKKKVVNIKVKAKGATEPFKEGWEAGVLLQQEMIFPADVTDRELSMSLMDAEEELIREHFEFEYE
jgi:hypothetical protein